MKQQVIEDVNIMPQLDKACGLGHAQRQDRWLYFL